ncbi:hypothetical protein [Streptomyces zagrosensis]|uniref:Uncharacterized protein n=1 Tax=Streptomyces zagrosensis TaxID=1042984 RepID=A0A7W9QDN3_9ACTN|nr:hypothetical protein [Streptomyces zagrosensis]MBB5937813.1 hypothetical protein [Streptomyces zagrosensis]
MTTLALPAEMAMHRPLGRVCTDTKALPVMMSSPKPLFRPCFDP